MIAGPGRRASIALLPLLGALLVAVPAHAADPRPLDAPRLPPASLVVPPLPLEYHTQERGGIRLSYHPSTGERVRSLEATVAQIRAELSAELGRPVLRAVEIRVAASPVEMSRLAPAERLGGNAFAFAFHDAGLVVMTAPSSRSIDAPALESLLRHALGHLALDEAVDGKPLPPWLHEGYAVEIAGDDGFSRARALTFAALGKRLVGMKVIEESYPDGPPEGSVAEAEAADFVHFLRDRPDRERFAALIAALREGKTVDVALASAYGESRAQIEDRWRKDLGRRHGFLPVLIAATLLWVVVAVGLAIRRARRRKALASAQKIERAAIERRRAVRASRPRPERLDDEILAETIVPEPEVPKVEHDGRWHTLH
ncbi:MAG: hypothetical protein U0359_36030 [Byssovorax sp.]